MRLKNQRNQNESEAGHRRYLSSPHILLSQDVTDTLDPRQPKPEVTDEEPPPKRKRGRPPKKKPTPPPATEGEGETSGAEAPPKKKRGKVGKGNGAMGFKPISR
jgi:hypothetical protein